MLGWRLPRRPGTTPPSTQAAPWLSRHVSAASISETSTWRPRPVCARSASAAWMPITASSPQTRSTTAAPTFSGGPSVLARDAHEAAHRLQQEVVAGQPRARLAGAEGGDRARDEPRVARAQRVAVEPPARHQPGTEGLEQHVGALGQPARQLAVALVAEVERDRALVAVQAEVVRRLAVAPRRTPGARVVAAVGPLDLDHVGAEVAEQHGGERPGEHAREVRDEESVERRHRPGTLVAGRADARRLRPAPRHRERRRPAAARRPARAAARRRSPASTGSSSSATGSSCARPPHRDAAGIAAPFFAEAGRALGPDGEIARARRQPRPRPRGGLDRRAPAVRAVRLPRASSSASSRRRPARWPRGWPSTPRPARLALAYPGRLAARGRLRASTATTPTCTPRCRRSSGSPPARWRARRAPARATARRPTTTRPRSRRSTRSCTSSPSAPTTRSSARAPARRRAPGSRWRARAPRAPAARAALGAGFARAVAALNALRPRPRSTAACPARRCAAAACTGCARCCARLGVAAPHVLWGHTHRSGPWPRDDPAEWRRRPARG